MTFAVYFIVQAMDVTLTGQEPGAAHGYLTEFVGNSLFLASPVEVRLETGLVALSILSYEM